MTNVRLIALCSPVMGSGKSVAASHLVANHGFALVKFAGPLKDMTRALLPHIVPAQLVETHVEGYDKETPLAGFDGLTTRRIMQTLGTEWGRETILPDLWTRIARERCRAILAAGQGVVIDDMRFLNEYDTVRELGGVSRRIVRPDAPRSEAVGHASEGELDRIAMPEIFNDGTVPQLHARLDALVESL